MGKRRKKSSLAKKKIGEPSGPRGSLGKGKGGGAWRQAFDAVDPPPSN